MMSASNWTICPKCQNRIKRMKEEFVKKYYGTLDGFVYSKMLNEIDKAIDYMGSYSEKEYKPDEEILKLMQDRKITVKINWGYGEVQYDADEILCRGKESCSLREDYEQGVNDDCSVYFYYSCHCDCGFSKDINYEESKDKIIKKKEDE